MPAILRICALACLVSAASAAQLTFVDEAQGVTPAAGTAEVTALYRFTHAGASPVRILGATSSCSCVVATPDRDLYLPGDSGVIVASFTAGDLTGLQVKTITIATDPPDEPPIRLSLTVHLVGPSIDRPMLVWKLGEQPFAQLVTLTMPDNGAYEFLDARPHGDGFRVTPVPDDRPHTIVLSVIPRTSEGAISDTIDIRTRPATRSSVRLVVSEIGPDGRLMPVRP